MNLALFFEGTGQGVAGACTNVTRMRDLCVEDGTQRLHCESGPGTHFGAYAVGRVSGIGWRQILARARKWFADAVAHMDADFSSASNGDGFVHDGRDRKIAFPKVFLFGFSRGALIARTFAEELGRQGFDIAYLGLWDTVDSTLNLDVPETCPRNVRAARHAVARDETRRFFSLVPLVDEDFRSRQNEDGTMVFGRDRKIASAGRCEQLVFPGSHSDVGGLYADNHVIADAALDWIAQGAVKAGLRLKPGTRIRTRRDFSRAALHSEDCEASNLWGAIDPVRRVLKGLRRHRSCRML